MNGSTFMGKEDAMGRILAIDYGLKRCGLAVTDPDRIIATPLEVVPAGDLLRFLKHYFSLEKVDVIVMGDPRKPDGTETHASEPVRHITRKLRQTFPDKDIQLVDERYTSRMALRTMIEGGTKKKDRRNKGTIDKISATIILQSYMEQQNNLH